MEVDLVDISTGDDLSYTWTIEGMPGPFTNPDLEDMVFVNSNQADSVFDVTLAIENSTVGCFDDTTMQLRIGYVPDPNVTPDTIICENSSLNLHAEGEKLICGIRACTSVILMWQNHWQNRRRYDILCDSYNR